MLCEVAYVTQGRASQKALDLVNISIAYFCRISSFGLFGCFCLFVWSFSLFLKGAYLFTEILPH